MSLEHCPVCGTAAPDSDVCSGCTTKLALMKEVGKRAENQKELALQAYTDGRYEEMFTHATRSLELKAEPECIKIAACAAMLTRRYAKAVSLEEDLAHFPSP